MKASVLTEYVRVDVVPFEAAVIVSAFVHDPYPEPVSVRYSIVVFAAPPRSVFDVQFTSMVFASGRETDTSLGVIGLV